MAAPHSMIDLCRPTDHHGPNKFNFILALLTSGVGRRVEEDEDENGSNKKVSEEEKDKHKKIKRMRM